MIGRSAADGWRYSSIMMNRTKGDRERKGQSDMHRNGKLYTKTTFSTENRSSVYLCKTHHHNDSVLLSGY